MTSLDRALHQSKVLAIALFFVFAGAILGVMFFLKQVADDNASRQRSAAQAELLERQATAQRRDVDCVKRWADSLEAWLIGRTGPPPRFTCVAGPRPTVTIAPPTVTRTAPTPPMRTVTVPQPARTSTRTRPATRSDRDPHSDGHQDRDARVPDLHRTALRREMRTDA